MRRAGKILLQHQVALELAADLPMLELDAVLFEQVLFNLLDNAAKYAPAGHHDHRSGACADERHRSSLQILDEGERHSAGRAGAASSTSSIARRRAIRSAPAPASASRSRRGFVEAMHGTISAANRTDRSGAVLTIRLPIPAASDALDTAA